MTPRPGRIFLPLLLSGMLATGLLLGGKMKDAGPVVEVVKYHDTLRTMAVEGAIEELIRYIDARYVDDLHRDSLIRKAIHSLMSQLDPHSEFLPSAEVQRLRETRDGRFSGIGVEFTIMDDTVYVLRTLPESPAREADLQPGDRLLQVDEHPVSGTGATPLFITESMRGEQGQRIRLKVWRPGIGNMDLQMRRASVHVPSVQAGLMLDSTVGYIAIRRFGAQTYREFMQEVERLSNEQGMEHLLLDLRGNPGGYLQEAVNILSQLFAERNRLLVYTVGRQKDRRDYQTSGKNFFRIGRLVVLVDEYSASASEIVAGAVQDWDRGLVAGRRTFGKGLVQEQYGLSNGAAVLLTVARYYTPSGRSIQRDYSDPVRYAETPAAPEGALPSGSDSTVYFTAKGREVYGGGGITPDVLFPPDTVRHSAAWAALTPWVHRYILQEFLLPGKDAEDAAGTGEAICWSRFQDMVRRRAPEWSSAVDKGPTAKALRLYLELEMTRLLEGEQAHHQLKVERDEEIRLALALFRDSLRFEALEASPEKRRR